MIQRFGPTLLATTVAAVLIFALPTGAQNSVTSRPGHLITQEINDNNMVTLHGNVRSQGERRQRSRSRSRRPAHGPPAAAIAAAPRAESRPRKTDRGNAYSGLTPLSSVANGSAIHIALWPEPGGCREDQWLACSAGLHVNVAYPAMRFFR